MRLFAKLVSSIALAAAAAPSTVNTARADFFCDVRAVHYAPITAVQTTTSTSFSNVPGAVVDFAVGMGACVIVEFSGQVRAPDPGAMRIRVVLDSADEGVSPPTAQLFTSANKFDDRSVTFIVQDITPGTRKARLQFLSVDGNPVSISRATMVLHYLPTF